MKLDILKKLTRLANNNPNENEANLAARRVCKMLEECNWILKDDFVPPKTPNASNPIYNPTYHPSNPTPPNSEYDFYRDVYNYYFYGGRRSGRTWNDVHRSEEPEFKSKPPNTDKTYENYEKYKEKNEYVYDSIFGKDRKNKSKEKRKLVCNTCKKEVETTFIGPPEVFECNSCQWTAYTRTKVERKY